ncbi:MAG: BamA/TamA family outer membrane protein, partial [Thermoanaerobaculia bacterium]|nr:BamA/TamA family outer membrane protein [Thermoanaerobaculia bacterium]
LRIDTTDSPTLASRGARLELGGVFSRTGLGAETSYERVDARFAWLVSRGESTWLWGLDAGTNLGSELPAYAEFLVGGLLSLGGYGEGELRGQRFGVARLGYRRQLLELPPGLGQGVYAALVLEAGDVWELGEEVDLGSPRWSTTALVGADTVLGPVFLAMARPSAATGGFTLRSGAGSEARLLRCGGPW